MSSGICINWDKLNDDVNKLGQKINEIDKIYRDLNNLYKELDGTTDTWVGENQKRFYQSYLELSSPFTNNVLKFREFQTFLNNVRETYKTSDASSKTSIEKQDSDLMA